MAEIIPLATHRPTRPFEQVREDYEQANRHFEAVCRSYDARCPAAVERFRRACRQREQALSAYLDAIRREADA